MARKSKSVNNTAVINPTITVPQPAGEDQKGPKIETCEVGMFRLPGVKVDFNQYTEEQVKEMLAWARENSAYVVEERGLFSWRKEAKRDWFVLRWS